MPPSFLRTVEEIVVMRKRTLVLLAILAVGCSAVRVHAPSSDRPAFAIHTIALPGLPADGVLMDVLAYDRMFDRVWVPAGNTGSVDVVDVTNDHVTRIEGFPTAERVRNGTTRIVGPSAAAVGDGVVYIGNRADAQVCVISAESLQRGPCATLDAPPDALAYVATAKEVWVTTPRDQSIVILDTAAPDTLPRKAVIRLEGRPEGIAVDGGRGVVYTNLEDRDHTLMLDIQQRQVTGTWASGCGVAGPKGLALDHGRNFLLVACRDRVTVVDPGRGGTRLSTLVVGDGVDDIDYVESRHELYAAAAQAATLTIARLDPHGGLALVGSVATVSGARNAVATEAGTAYLTDSSEGKILVVAPVGTVPWRRK